MIKHSKTLPYSSLWIIASFSNFPSAFASFIGTRRLTDEDHLSLQFLKHLSWPCLAFPNMFHCETFNVIWLTMKDDQWIINFSHLDIFNSISASCIGGDLVSVWGSASATSCLVYQEQGFSPSHRPPFGISVPLPSPLSLALWLQVFWVLPFILPDSVPLLSSSFPVLWLAPFFLLLPHIQFLPVFSHSLKK